MKTSPCDDKNFRECPNCGSKMTKGLLQTAGRGVSRIFLKIEDSEKDSSGYYPVCVWFCRNCGEMLLFADITVTNQDSHNGE